MLLLSRGELSVAELQQILGMGQSRISSSLAKLKQAGLVNDRRYGKHSYYALATGASSRDWELLRELIAQSGEQIEEASDDLRALKLVHDKRKDKARAYFDQLAGKFGRNYCPGRSWRSLSRMLLAFFPRAIVADLGAGEGTLSQMLARRASQVIAVDNSEKMVEYGLRIARENDVPNLEYRLGDIESPPIDPESVDIAILSQALHHAINPGAALQAAFNILKPGGRIAVMDLLSHSHVEAREMYADIWLGFSELQLLTLLEDAGFQQIDVGPVAKDPKNPEFQTLLATAVKPGTD